MLTTTNELLKKWKHTYDTYGLPRSTTDPLNQTTYTYFDSIGRLYGSIDGNGKPTNYSNNAYGEPIEVTDALSYTTVYTYDAVGNLINTRDPKGNVITNTYNLDNQPVRVTQPDSSYSETFYDGLGRVVSQTNGLRQVTTYTYGDATRTVTETDPLSRSSLSVYDLAGRLDHTADQLSRTTNFSYYANNQLHTIDYGDGVTPAVSYTYNSRGLRTSMTDGIGTATYSYDSLGRVASVTDDLGRITQYYYDQANNVYEIDYPTVNGEPRHILRYYDDDNRLTLTGSGQFGGSSVSYGYDANNNPTYITYTGSLRTKIDYDAVNRVITSTSTTLDKSPNYTLSAYSYQRDPDGLIIADTNKVTNAVSLVNSSHNYYYDIENRLIGQWLTNTLYPSNALQVISNTWSYDNASQLTASVSMPIADPTGTLTNTTAANSYDVAGELSAITSTITYTSSHATEYYTNTYNLAGDRTKQVHRLPDGSIYTTTLGYDAASRLITYTGGYDGVQTLYKYDGDGLRMGKSGSDIYVSPAVTYTWDTLGVGAGGLPLLIREDTADGSGFDVAHYLYGLNSIPLLEADYPTTIPYSQSDALPGANSNNKGQTTNKGNSPLAYDDPRYFLPDGQGNIRIVYGSVGSVTNDVLAAFDYGAYGNKTCSLDTNVHEPCLVNPRFGYTGQYQDNESGLLYLRDRYYDPTSQQFISRDPLEARTGQPYAYANANPINVSDPSGLEGNGPWDQTLPGVPGGLSLESGSIGGYEAGSGARTGTGVGDDAVNANGEVTGRRVSREQALTDVLTEIATLNAVIQTDEEAVEYLDWATAVSKEMVNASTLDPVIYIRPEYANNVRTLREEVIHIYQTRGEFSTDMVVDSELDARLRMITNRFRWGLTNSEVRQLIHDVRIIQRTGRY